MEFTTKSAAETKKVGQKIASLVLKKKIGSQNALLFCLDGDLGSGKTTFTKGLANSLGIKKRILSPTFILLREYPLSVSNFKKFIHIDLYRLADRGIPNQLEEIGFPDIYEDPQNIIVIEWADKASNFLKNKGVWIKFSQTGVAERKIGVNIK